MCAVSKAQQTGTQDYIDPVIEDIIRSYLPWQSAEFSGKLRYDKLPLSPAVKMYMVRDSLLQISVRAPLLGEIGRLDLTRDELTVVNKMKRTYCRESAEKLMEIYPGLIGDIQSVFLARVTVLGSGELDHENFEAVSVEEDREGGWMLIPATGNGIVDLNYGFLVGPGSRTRALVAALADKGTLQIAYSYADRGEQMQIEFEGKGRKFEATLDFSSVKWGGSEMPPVRLDNYKRQSIKEFISSIRK